MFLFVDDELKHRQVDKLVFDWEVGKKTNQKKKRMNQSETCSNAGKHAKVTLEQREEEAKKKWNLRITLLSHGLKFLILVYTETI